MTSLGSCWPRHHVFVLITPAQMTKNWRLHLSQALQGFWRSTSRGAWVRRPALDPGPKAILIDFPNPNLVWSRRGRSWGRSSYFNTDILPLL